MLTLEQLHAPTDGELTRLDVAAVDLACVDGLPGAVNLDIPTCLAWIDRAAAWVRHDTGGTIEDFRRRPEEFNNSEGTFRIVSMMSVLQRGLGVRYNPALIDNPRPPADSRDDFIHGIIAGPGGTCASIPVLFVAVGRRLGYPLKLVTSVRHLFARWDDAGGERFNVEVTNRGLNTFPDDYYRNRSVRSEADAWWWQKNRFLRSLTPREELAFAWQKRGFCLHANGLKGEAVKAFAIARSLTPADFQSEFYLANALQEWKIALQPRIPPGLAMPEIELSGRWYPGLHVDLERDIIRLDVIQNFLNRIECGPDGSILPQRIRVAGPRGLFHCSGAH